MAHDCCIHNSNEAKNRQNYINAFLVVFACFVFYASNAIDYLIAASPVIISSISSIHICSDEINMVTQMMTSLPNISFSSYAKNAFMQAKVAATMVVNNLI